MITNDIFCEFKLVSENQYVCIKCNTIIESIDSINDIPIFPCLNPFGDSIDLDKLKSQISIEEDEGDLCSDQEIEHRYSICSSCEFFQNQSCSKCGCLLQRSRVYMNKLAIKQEKCPEKKW
jgi:hypothetical protein